jgi:hypothetical protein
MLYTDLYQAVQDFTEYTEASFLANIPFFVKLAEEDIYRKANFPLQSRVGSATLVAGVNTVVMPNDFLSFEYVNVFGTNGKYNMLLNKEVDYIYQVWSDPTYRAIPQHYNLRDAYTIVIGPTPDQAYTMTYQYVSVPTSIVNAGATGTWLGDNAQNPLLYGTLVQAYLYMKGDQELLAHYKMLYDESLKTAKELGEAWDRSDAYRSPPPRNIPQGTP